MRGPVLITTRERRPIAAAFLGPVKRSVGRGDQTRSRCAPLPVHHRDPDTDRHRTELTLAVHYGELAHPMT